MYLLLTVTTGHWTATVLLHSWLGKESGSDPDLLSYKCLCRPILKGMKEWHALSLILLYCRICRGTSGSITLALRLLPHFPGQTGSASRTRTMPYFLDSDPQSPADCLREMKPHYSLKERVREEKGRTGTGEENTTCIIKFFIIAFLLSEMFFGCSESTLLSVSSQRWLLEHNINHSIMPPVMIQQPWDLACALVLVEITMCVQYWWHGVRETAVSAFVNYYFY